MLGMIQFRFWFAICSQQTSCTGSLTLKSVKDVLYYKTRNMVDQLQQDPNFGNHLNGRFVEHQLWV